MEVQLNTILHIKQGGGCFQIRIVLIRFRAAIVQFIIDSYPLLQTHNTRQQMLPTKRQQSSSKGAFNCSVLPNTKHYFVHSLPFNMSTRESVNRNHHSDTLMFCLTLLQLICIILLATTNGGGGWYIYNIVQSIVKLMIKTLPRGK